MSKVIIAAILTGAMVVWLFTVYKIMVKSALPPEPPVEIVWITTPQGVDCLTYWGADSRSLSCNWQKYNLELKDCYDANYEESIFPEVKGDSTRFWCKRELENKITEIYKRGDEK